MSKFIILIFAALILLSLKPRKIRAYKIETKKQYFGKLTKADAG